MTEESLPPYTYTPGVTPHPISDPRGHSYGRHGGDVGDVEPERIEACTAFQHGRQLFQRGYYWEAHEEWEAVWKAVGRRGPAADFLKGLIKLAAAGVKVREGNRDGVRRHARRAAELFRAVRFASGADHVAGASLGTLETFADCLAADGHELAPLEHSQPVVFWPHAFGSPGGL